MDPGRRVAVKLNRYPVLGNALAIESSVATNARALRIVDGSVLGCLVPVAAASQESTRRRFSQPCRNVMHQGRWWFRPATGHFGYRSQALAWRRDAADSVLSA